LDQPQGEAELEALLTLSQRSRAKLDRLHEVLTTPVHYGKGASPAAIVYEENKLKLLRLLDADGNPRTGPPVLFIPAPVSRYFIIDLLPGRSFAGHVAEAGFDVFIADFGVPTSEDRFCDLAYYVDGLIRRCVRTVCALTGETKTSIVGYCLGGTLSLLVQLVRGDHDTVNDYTRVVREDGNLKAQEILYRVFEMCDSHWRGIGIIPGSGLSIIDEFSDLAEKTGGKVEIISLGSEEGDSLYSAFNGIAGILRYSVDL